jgi:hypothetical protein
VLLALGRSGAASVDGGALSVTPPDSSAAEELAQSAPGARFVKAFNTTFAGTLSEGRVAGPPLDVFIAGDDPDAKATVAGLARDGGLNPIDAGPLKRARELEAMGLLHVTLQGSLGTAWRAPSRSSPDRRTRLGGADAPSALRGEDLVLATRRPDKVATSAHRAERATV